MTDKQKEKLLKLRDFLIEQNKIHNLTAITDKDEIWQKHFLDSIQGAEHIKQGASVVDIGSGGGFPAVPLAVVRDDISITAIDSNNKKVEFLNQVCKLLELNNLVAVHASAEMVAKTKRESFDVATARAVAPMNTLLELLAPLTRVGGQLVLYKGKNYQEELDECQKAIEALGLELSKTFDYTLPNGQVNTLVIFDKIITTPPQYPRSNNNPRKKPL